MTNHSLMKIVFVRNKPFSLHFFFLMAENRIRRTQYRTALSGLPSSKSPKKQVDFLFNVIEDPTVPEHTKRTGRDLIGAIIERRPELKEEYGHKYQTEVVTPSTIEEGAGATFEDIPLSYSESNLSSGTSNVTNFTPGSASVPNVAARYRQPMSLPSSSSKSIEGNPADQEREAATGSYIPMSSSSPGGGGGMRQRPRRRQLSGMVWEGDEYPGQSRDLAADRRLQAHQAAYAPKPRAERAMQYSSPNEKASWSSYMPWNNPKSNPDIENPGVWGDEVGGRSMSRNHKLQSAAVIAGGTAVSAAIGAGMYMGYNYLKDRKRKKKLRKEQEAAAKAMEGTGMITGQHDPANNGQYGMLVNLGGPTAQDVATNPPPQISKVGAAMLSRPPSIQAANALAKGAVSSGGGGPGIRNPPPGNAPAPGQGAVGSGTAPTTSAGSGTVPAGEAPPGAPGPAYGPAGVPPGPGQPPPKAEGPDPNRMEPITPATGSQQTPANANQNVSIEKFADEVAGSEQMLGTAAVMGTARERANMGKGEEDNYNFEGPYDAPTFPGGKVNNELTLMGAWRTKKGNASHLYFGNKNSRGGLAKRGKYYKWSTKNGGNWRQMSKQDALNVFSKPSRGEPGSGWLTSPGAGTSLKNILSQTMLMKGQDQKMAMQGAANSEYNKEGEMGGALEGEMLGGSLKPPKKKKKLGSKVL